MGQEWFSISQPSEQRTAAIQQRSKSSKLTDSRMSKSLIKLSNWITNGERNNLFWSEPNFSKTIGMKMKKKEPQGDTDELAEGLSALSLTQKENTEVHEIAQGLNVKQLKAVVAQIAELVPATKAEAEKLRVERDAAMGHIGNLLGPDVPISNDEDADNAIVRMVRD